MSDKNYKVMPLRDVLKYEDEAKEKGVSEVARSSSGFLGQYKKFKDFDKFKDKKASNSNMDWEDKRESFIARHLASYRRNPTRRRKIALAIWAYDV